MSALDEKTEREDIRTVALRLARYNAESDPSVKEIYLFPDEEEIRLIEVDELSLEIDAIIPFYFDAAPDVGITFPSAIALIRPSEKLPSPPEKWGGWERAQRIWPETT